MPGFGSLSILGRLPGSTLLRFALPGCLLTRGLILGGLLIASGLLALIALTLRLFALLAWLLAVAFLWGANGLLPDLGLLRTGRLRFRLALLCSLAFAALATLHAGFIFLLLVIVAATTVLPHDRSCAHG